MTTVLDGLSCRGEVLESSLTRETGIKSVHFVIFINYHLSLLIGIVLCTLLSSWKKRGWSHLPLTYYTLFLGVPLYPSFARHLSWNQNSSSKSISPLCSADLFWLHFSCPLYVLCSSLVDLLFMHVFLCTVWVSVLQVSVQLHLCYLYKYA